MAARPVMRDISPMSEQTAGGPDEPTLAEILTSEMARLGYNDYSLAMAAGLKADVIRDIKRGKSKSPAAARVDAIARVLHRTPGQLLGKEPLPSLDEPQSEDTPGDGIDHPTELALITLWRILTREERKHLLVAMMVGLNSKD